MYSILKKMTGGPLSSAKRVKAQSPNLTWLELKRELLMVYSIIQSDSHATQDFTQLEQGLDELLDVYLHCSSELLSKIYHVDTMWLYFP